MGATAVTTTPDFTNSKAGICAETFTLEVFDTTTSSWYTASISTPAFVTSIGVSGNFDTYLDGIDAPSVALRPETSFTVRITVFLADSVQGISKTTIQDLVTISIVDECKDDQLSYTTSTLNQGYLVGSGTF